MPKRKNIKINYTNRDFDSIKTDLIEYAKRYYPDVYQDFTDASFGSMMFDLVSYVGDNISFYLDYQVNESFLETAIEPANVRKHSKSLGYTYYGSPVSFGVASFFVLVPANADGLAPDTTYIPTLKKNSTFKSSNGVSFVLLEDVDFSDPKNDVVEAKYNSTTGGPTFYAIRAHGQVSSGKLQMVEVDLSNASFKKFRRVRIGNSDISEIIKVVDDSGNEYFQVDYLSQETVLMDTTNPNARADGVRSIMKPFVTARRFILEQDPTGTYLQFGFGSEDDDDSGLADPSQVAINLHARDYISDKSIDPNKLLGTDKLGVSPTGVILKAIYRVNDSSNVNVGARKLDKVNRATLTFNDPDALNSSIKSIVVGSLEVTNQDPIVGQVVDQSPEEIKIFAKNTYAAQNRAVTKQDFEAIAYNMPTKFGQIKRVNVINDPMSTNRKLAMYVLGSDNDGNLTRSNDRVKQNLKAWLSRYKGINDHIEIFDGKVVNFGIDFEIAVDRRFSNDNILNEAINNLKKFYSSKLYMGEPIYITDIYNVLAKTKGVIDIKKVDVFNKYGGSHSTTPLDFEKIRSKDGTFYKTPKNVVMELKFPERDIKGIAK